jgi:hypothetical protein
MRIAALYSVKDGERVIRSKYPHLLKEIEEAIASVDASQHKTKKSREKTMMGKMLYSPSSLNRAFKDILYPKGWKTVKERCEYSTAPYVEGYTPPALKKGQFREMDFVKEKLGVEIQFGKYSFMVYNVSAKMTIFSNCGHIDTGVEIVPMKAFADDMSSGVSYFEQFEWDLRKRGIADIDIPVLIIGIDASPPPSK